MKTSLTPLNIAECMQLGNVATTLIKLRQDQLINSIIITSCSPGEGKTSVAIQLAIAAASEAQLRVLLIDFNPINPVLASLFNVSSTPGFSDYLDGDATAQDVIQTTSPGGPDLIPYGNTRGGLLTRYNPPQLKEKITALSSINGCGYDLVVLDGPSSFREPDLSLTACVFDGIILVIECERTRWEVVRHYQKSLQDAKANLIGTVLNKRKYYIPRGLYV